MYLCICIFLGKYIDKLWSLEAIQATFNRRKTYFLFPDHMDYFFETVCDIMDKNYTSTRTDALKVGIQTTEVIKLTFKALNHRFEIHDISGLRNERYTVYILCTMQKYTKYTKI